jgi:hypothetical protein
MIDYIYPLFAELSNYVITVDLNDKKLYITYKEHDIACIHLSHLFQQ